MHYIDLQCEEVEKDFLWLVNGEERKGNGGFPITQTSKGSLVQNVHKDFVRLCSVRSVVKTVLGCVRDTRLTVE